jgi:hypothetical protein
MLREEVIKMNKKILVPTIALTVLSILGVVGTKTIKADDVNNYPPIVQRLVEKFNLNEDDVKKVFDEERQQRQDDRQKQLEEGLNKAVSDGVITSEQKQAFLDKHSNMEQQRGQNREEMQTWFEENGIDQTKLSSYIGFMGRGFGKGFGEGPNQ